MLNIVGRRGCLGGHLELALEWRIIPTDGSTQLWSELKSVIQNWRYVRYYVNLGRLMHTMPCCIPYAVYNTLLWQSRSNRGLLWSVSLYSGARWAFLYTEQDWNIMKICSRMHVSIITNLMRTMNLLLACIHHTLNPQPKAIIIITMSFAIIFPLRLLWVMQLVTANQLFACFPLRLLLFNTSCCLLSYVAELVTLDIYCTIGTNTGLHVSGLLSLW